MDTNTNASTRTTGRAPAWSEAPAGSTAAAPEVQAAAAKIAGAATDAVRAAKGAHDETQDITDRQAAAGWAQGHLATAAEAYAELTRATIENISWDTPEAADILTRVLIEASTQLQHAAQRTAAALEASR
jgi:hypothetical protein